MFALDQNKKELIMEIFSSVLFFSFCFLLLLSFPLSKMIHVILVDKIMPLLC